MTDVLCPHCGLPNPPGQDECSFCGKSIPVAGGSNAIRPGDTPTKKITAELEPVLPEWLREAREKARRVEAEAATDESRAEAQTPEPKEKAPDLLAGLASASREDREDEIPEWMRGAAPVSVPARASDPTPTFPRRQEIRWEEENEEDAMGGMANPPIPSAPESGDAMLPWMQEATGAKPAEDNNDEVSDWLAERTGKPQAREKPSVSPFDTGSLKPPDAGELTDWLAEATSESAAQSGLKSEFEDSLNDWLSNLPREELPSATAETGESFGEDIDLPAWMASAEERPPAQKKDDAGKSSVPDWLISKEPSPAQAKEEAWTAAGSTESAPGPPGPPAFITDKGPADSGQARELFSIEMPDWLSNIAPADQKSAPVESQESITPADLPSWVQAMRPVETVLPGSSAAQPTIDGPVESNGPLAGLRGVLPLEGGLIQPGKSRVQSIKLQASEAQQSEAMLLEQILAAETQAEPLRGGGRLASQRVLRWSISALLILLVTLSLLAGLQGVPLPVTLPLGENNRVLGVLDSLPEGAPVLMVFDYEPALAGEMEAVAAPFVDRVLGLRHPRLTILSTSPTGAALAERFLGTTQVRHNYQLGLNYINLGYLPGGMTGVLSFAANPRIAIPSESWNLPPAQAVNRFADYAVVILITDQSETARVWVEQTYAYRNGRPMLVVSSAQVVPMIQPYLLSGQVNGLVGGLRGSTAFEASSGIGSPVRRYWDAYNYSIVFAALVILFGGLWSLFAGMRARRQELDEA